VEWGSVMCKCDIRCTAHTTRVYVVPGGVILAWGFTFWWGYFFGCGVGFGGFGGVGFGGGGFGGGLAGAAGGAFGGGCRSLVGLAGWYCTGTPFTVLYIGINM